MNAFLAEIDWLSLLYLVCVRVRGHLNCKNSEVWLSDIKKGVRVLENFGQMLRF